MNNEIARVAFRGMCSDDPEVMQICLDKIWHMATKGISEAEASQVVNDTQQEKVKADDKLGKYLDRKFGTYEGHSKFKLALDFFQMSNDRFFEIYKFNFVPRGKLAETARKYIENRQLMAGEQLGLSVSAMNNMAITPEAASRSLEQEIRNAINKSMWQGGAQ